MSKTLQELAQEALRVQDACNLWAVVNGFARALGHLDELTKGTTERDNHPIARVWADKVNHLTGTQGYMNGDPIQDAYDEVHKLANE